MYQSYHKLVTGAPGMVVAEYRGMRMKDVNVVRNALRPVDGKFAVVKATIFRIVLRELGFAAPKDLFSGPIAVAVAKNDVAKVTKAFLAVAKDQPLMVLRGAVMGASVFKEDQLEALSTLPTLEEARASFLGTLTSPASGLVGLLNQPAQGLAMVLKAFTDKQQGGSDAEPAA
jgi:large subunit ribosomal protein L10